MEFFDKLTNLYSNIQFPKQYEEITKIDKAISWYYADKSNQFISAKKTVNNYIIELDMKNAFTTICNCLFADTDHFVVEMNKITDKKTRNIYIAINLKDTEYLRLLNIICKICIMGTIFECGESDLLELKKDGAVFLCNEEVAQKVFNLVNNSTPNGELTNFLINKSFKFHADDHLKYIRSNRTSYFLTSNNIIVKGLYKHTPLEISKIQYLLYTDQNIDINKYLKIYSKLYFEILQQNGLFELIKLYYSCDGLNYLSFDGKYTKQLRDVDPKNYLRTFIYPIILASKM
jgi:hypothetical protein